MELVGLEPTTSSLRTRRSPRLSYSPTEGGTVVILRYFGDLVLAGETRRSRFSRNGPAWKIGQYFGEKGGLKSVDDGDG